MTTATSQRQPNRTGQTVVVIGGGADSGLQRAEQARAECVGTILPGRIPDSVERAAAGQPGQSDHVMVTVVGPAAR